MKKIILMLLLMASFIFAKETITIGIGEWAPFNGEKLPHYGMSSHITTDVFALEGINVKYEFMPWKRVIVLTERAECDGTIEWTKTQKKLKQFYFAEKPLLISKVVVFHRKNYDFDFEKYEDLFKERIGLTRGYAYGNKIDEFLMDGKSKVANTDEVNLRNLLLNRIDLFFCDLLVGRKLLNEKFSKEEKEKIIYSEIPIEESNLYFIVSKKHPRAKEIINKFDLGMNKIIKSGRYQQYYDDLVEGKYDEVK